MRRILVRASLYTWGFLAAAILVAMGGSALVAWVLSRAGLPFFETWLAVSILILLPTGLLAMWRAFRDSP